jgi:long-chain acyl-CoA synthetase
LANGFSHSRNRYVVKYAQDNKIPYTSYASLTQHPEIKKLIQAAVDGANKSLASVETIMNCALLPKKFYEEDGEVMPP